MTQQPKVVSLFGFFFSDFLSKAKNMVKSLNGAEPDISLWFEIDTWREDRPRYPICTSVTIYSKDNTQHCYARFNYDK